MLFSAILSVVLAMHPHQNLKVVQFVDATHGLSIKECMKVISEAQEELDVKGLTDKFELRCVKSSDTIKEDKPKEKVKPSV